MLRQKFIVQVTTLPDCDDITRFDGIIKKKLKQINHDLHTFLGGQNLRSFF